MTVPHDHPIRLRRGITAREHEVDDGANILDRGVAAHDRRIGLRVLRHLLRPARFAVAADVEEVHVVAACGDVIHPGLAIKREVKCGARGIGRAMLCDLICPDLPKAL